VSLFSLYVCVFLHIWEYDFCVQLAVEIQDQSKVNVIQKITILIAVIESIIKFASSNIRCNNKNINNSKIDAKTLFILSHI
jgi:hypothetical protein